MEIADVRLVFLSSLAYWFCFEPSAKIVFLNLSFLFVKTTESETTLAINHQNSKHFYDFVNIF